MTKAETRDRMAAIKDIVDESDHAVLAWFLPEEKIKVYPRIELCTVEIDPALKNVKLDELFHSCEKEITHA